MSSCPEWNDEKQTQVCPECGGDLDCEDVDEDELQYCGPGCSDCGWRHCGDCI